MPSWWYWWVFPDSRAVNLEHTQLTVIVMTFLLLWYVMFWTRIDPR